LNLFSVDSQNASYVAVVCSILSWLVKLEVDSLELRRICFDLIYVCKLLFDMVDADVSALFVADNVDTVTRGHSRKLFVQQSRTDARKYFFSNRVIQSWNSLPAHTRRFFIFSVL